MEWWCYNKVFATNDMILSSRSEIINPGRRLSVWRQTSMLRLLPILHERVPLFSRWQKVYFQVSFCISFSVWVNWNAFSWRCHFWKPTSFCRGAEDIWSDVSCPVRVAIDAWKVRNWKPLSFFLQEVWRVLLDKPATLPHVRCIVWVNVLRCKPF